MSAGLVRQEPLVVVETTGLTEDEWLDYRRKGLGGSDAAAVMGLSPFCTCRDLYRDKLGIEPAGDDDKNWVALEVGHRLESLVAEIFRRKTDLKVWEDKRMFAHPDPEYSFMQADLDFMVQERDGRQGILEIKTTNFFCRDHWDDDNVPVNYELQGRHYMAVMDLDFVWYACLYGNNDSQFIMRRIDRDLEFEKEMIEQEHFFWNEYVLKKREPPYTEDVNLVLASIRKHYGVNNITSIPIVTIPPARAVDIKQYLDLAEQKRQLDREARALDKKMKTLYAPIIDQMGNSCNASCVAGGESYSISYAPTYRTGISSDDLKRLKIAYPDVYDQFVTTTVSRSFKVEKEGK